HRLLHSFPTRRSSDLFSTWLHTITTTVVLNGLRKVKRFRQREADIDDAHEIGVVQRHAEPDMKARLKQAIYDLPEGYRTVFLMRSEEHTSELQSRGHL